MNKSTYRDPTSYTFQEGEVGQTPPYVPIAAFNIRGGQGVPSATLGANGDFYLRSDGAAGANTTIYHKEGGIWIGLTC